MTPLTREWVEKAEADYATAVRELRARTHPNYDAACFHAQQCAEKYLKACLQEAGIASGKTHDLVALIDLVAPGSALKALRPTLQALTAYAVTFRYPGCSADKQLAKEALRDCRQVREPARHLLGLENG